MVKKPPVVHMRSNKTSAVRQIFHKILAHGTTTSTYYLRVRDTGTRYLVYEYVDVYFVVYGGSYALGLWQLFVHAVPLQQQ